MSEDTTTAAARLAHLPPLGWVARRVEDGLSRFVDALFDDGFGLGRRHWQLLRRTAENPDRRVETYVAEAAIFYTDAEARRVVEDLLDRGWIRRDDGPDPELALTAEGRSGFEAMRAAQERTWAVVLDGLSEADYVAAVTAMARMADNLERADADRGRSR